MRPLKKILRSAIIRRLLCWIGAQYIRLVYTTGRWTVVRGSVPSEFWQSERPFILAFWHGRLLMMPYCWDHKATIHMLISPHRDGQIIANTVGHFGIKTITGSSSRGGAGALRAMIKALGAGECVGITPDGPRGPAMRSSEGIVTVARMSGVPIIPATFGMDKRRVLSTWDGFMIAWPFARGVVVWGEPIHVPRKADKDALEAARRQVEQSLNEITAEADRISGHDPQEPASPARDAAS